MNIKRIVMGPLEANCYILYKNEGGPAVIVDPGYDPKVYAGFIKEKRLMAVAILCTHHHSDHTGGATELSDSLACPIYMHEKELPFYDDRVDQIMSNGDKFNLDGETIKILHTPGHTKGSVCIYMPSSKIVLTGDTIFDVDLGITSFPGGSERDMAWSMHHVVDRWEDDITIYPGHDVSATMEYVRRHNKEFIALRDGKRR